VSDIGGERAASLYSLQGSARLNEINPETYLRHVLSVIPDHPVTRVAELLPLNLKLDDNYQKASIKSRRSLPGDYFGLA
jgi:hypothetical protein